MVRPAELRWDSLAWAYRHTHVGRNGLVGRRIVAEGFDKASGAEVRRLLTDVFDQVDFRADEPALEEDELAELWSYMLDHWDLDMHDELVDHLTARGLLANPNLDLRYEGHFLPAALKVRRAEAKQVDVEAIVDELELFGADW